MDQLVLTKEHLQHLEAMLLDNTPTRFGMPVMNYLLAIAKEQQEAAKAVEEDEETAFEVVGKTRGK